MTDNSPATELLPCPFCGGDAYTAEEQNRHPNDGWWDVRCRGCNAQIREECSKEGAIREWNTRIRAETAKNSGEVVAWLTRVNYRREGQSEFLVCEKDQAGAFPVYAASGGVDNVR